MEMINTYVFDRMNIRRFALLLICICSLHFVLAAQECSIVPLPGNCRAVKAVFSLNGQTSIVQSSDDLRPLTAYLQREILQHTGMSLMVQQQADVPVIKLELSGKRDEAASERYSIKMDARGIKIVSGDKEGIFRGLVSLMQLIRSGDKKDGSVAVSCWNIEDAPAYGWRGLMLDESRHFFGKEKVKSILDWMGFYKLNRFHWHLTDQPGWRIEIKKYPRLALAGGIGNHSDPYAPASYYTQADITEIVTYAAERFITVIPEIDMPGHATAANNAYPEFSGGGSEKYPQFTFNPGKAGTYTYLSEILKEVNVLFPSGMVHIGGDEVHFGNQHWNDDADVQRLMKDNKLADLKAVEHYFIRRMADSLTAMNSKVLAWDEITNAELPVDKTIVFWWRHDKPEELRKALDKGYQTVICPRLPLYFDFVQDSAHVIGRKWNGAYNSLEDVYSYSPEGLASASARKQIKGVQGNLWTEYVSTVQNLDFLLFPRICALAEMAWCGPGKKNYPLFQNRVKKQLELFRQAGLYYYDPFRPAQTPEYNNKGKRAQPGL